MKQFVQQLIYSTLIMIQNTLSWLTKYILIVSKIGQYLRISTSAGDFIET